MSLRNSQDDRLGLNDPISRRDFLNGALLASAGLLLHGNAPPISPADAFDGYGGIGDYRHSNGNIWDVLRAGHAMRDGAFERRLATAIDTGEIYDLVAVGGGISGLAAAIFFQKYLGGGALVIDNHPIFGGEAKRNEFLVDGQRLTAHQGSAIFLVPQPGGYTDRFYAMIGMDRSSFTYQTWRGPAPEMPLSHSPYDTPSNYGFYFGPQFGQRPGVWVTDPWRRRLEGAPLSDTVKAELLRWGTSRVDIRALEGAGQAIRLRPNSTVVAVEHAGDPASAPHVVITYVKGDRLYKVTARSVVMAGGSWTTKHIVHDLPASHREAYAQFYRSPCLMANIAVRNWRWLYNMGVSGCRWFGGLGDYLSVRKMALVGNEAPTIGPDSPTVLTIKVLFAQPGLPIAEQGALGRAQLLGTSFAQYERAFREQLGDMFAPGGFDPRRDIAGIILNRWGHAYVNPQPGFFFGVNGKPAPRDVLRGRPHGRIAFANTDLAGASDHRNSIREADRAVKQLLGA